MQGADIFGKIMDSLKKENYTPSKIEDVSFEPFTGKYIARIMECGRKMGISQRSGEPYDFISLKLEVVEVKEGDKAIGRRLDKIYNMDDTGVKKLMDDLFTAGITDCNASTTEEFMIFLGTLTDKLVNVSAWSRPKQVKNPDTGNWEEAIPRENKQWFKIVATLKLKDGESVKTEKVPF